MSGLHVVFADVKGGLVPFLRLLDDVCKQTQKLFMQESFHTFLQNRTN